MTTMPEFMNSTELALEAARAANHIFDEMQRTEAGNSRNALAAEFVALQAVAGVVLAPPVRDQDDAARQQKREAISQERLGVPMDSLVEDLMADSDFKPASPVVIQRSLNTLDRENVYTLRGVLIVGREKVGKMRNFGDKGMTFLENVIFEVDPTLDWPDRPTPAYVAKLCSGPEQIPARAVCSEFDGFFINVTGIHTLADLLELNLKSMTQLLRKRYHGYGKSNEEIASIAQGILQRTVTYARNLEEVTEVK